MSLQRAYGFRATGPAGLVGAGDIATSALGRCRYAAFSGLGASAISHFLDYTTSVTLPTSLRISLCAVARFAPNAQCAIHGRTDGNQPRLDVLPTGAIRAYYGGTAVGDASSAGVFPFDGLVHKITETWILTTTNISVTVAIDGIVKYSVSLNGSFTAPSAAQRIGALNAGAQRWTGAVFDFHWENLTDSTKSFFLALDEPAGNYLNAYQVVGDPLYSAANTAAASAVRNGYVSTVPVLSLDGRGMPWQGAPVPLIYSVATTNDYSFTATGGTQPFTGGAVATAEIDPTGWFTPATGVWAPQAPGAFVATFSVGLFATTLAAPDVVALQILHSNGTTGQASMSVAAINTRYARTATLTGTVAAGQTLTFHFISLVTGDAFTVQNGSVVTIQFYPTPVTG